MENLPIQHHKDFFNVVHKAVSAKWVYETIILDSNPDFRSWLIPKITEYNYKETEDYFVEGDDYLLTLDVVKELCLLQNTVEAREVRNHLINIEKEYWQNLRQSFLFPMKVSNQKIYSRMVQQYRRDSSQPLEQIVEESVNLLLSKGTHYRIPKDDFAPLGVGVIDTRKGVARAATSPHKLGSNAGKATQST